MSAHRRRPARLFAVLLLAVPLLLVPAGHAAAVTSGSVVEQLQQDQVYVERDLELAVDTGAVRAAVAASDVPVFVAVVSGQTAERAGGTTSLVERIGVGTRSSSSSVLVLTEDLQVEGASGERAREAGVDGAAAAGLVAASVRGREDLTAAEVTAAVALFLDTLAEQAARGSGASLQDGQTGGGAGTGLALGLLALGGAGLGLSVLTRRRRRTTPVQP